jgi:ferredoxin
MNMMAGKADLEDSTEEEDGIFVREVPEDMEDAAKSAAESCPVDAIYIYEDDEQILP